MIASLECLPCLSHQATVTARLSTGSTTQQQAGLGEALMHLAIMEPATPPAMVAEDLQRTLSRHTGAADPYLDVRQRLTLAAKSLLPALLRMKQKAHNPREIAIRVAAAGNLLEAARDPAQAGAAMEAAWEATARGQLAIDHSAALHDTAAHARHIVYLADNAGEVIWDRLLIEQLGAAKVTLVVRLLPYLHDALAEDLDFSSWLVAPRVVAFDNPLAIDSSKSPLPSLDRLLAKADLIIAKGSDWPERLAGHVPTEKCFFILAPSCRRVASWFGVSPQALVVAHAATLLSSTPDA